MGRYEHSLHGTGPTVTIGGSRNLLVTAAAAWVVENGEPHTFGSLVDTELIPIMVRRRLTGAALAAMRCGLGALPPTAKPVEMVSCARHGDLPRTQRMLLGMVNGTPPSPLDFSLSVHNALAGMLDLLRRERTGHTSIAAGRDTLAAAFLELWVKMQCSPDKAALLLYVEQPVPEELRERTDPAEGGTVLALGLEHDAAPDRQGVDGTGGGAQPLAVLRRTAAGGGAAPDSEVAARQIIRALRDGGSVRLPGTIDFDWLLERRA